MVKYIYKINIKEKNMDNKEFAYVAAGLDFAFTGFNIYWAISHNNPLSIIAAILCLVSGIMLLTTN